VAFGNEGDNEHQRMSEHCQSDGHQLRGVRHHAAADENTDGNQCLAPDYTSSAAGDQIAVEK